MAILKKIEGKEVELQSGKVLYNNRPLNNQITHLSKYIIHRRPLYGLAGDTIVHLQDATRVKIRNELYYQLNSYGMNDVPAVTTGCSRFIRFYAVYSDDARTNPGMRISLYNGSDVSLSKHLDFTLTWGGRTARRDGYNYGFTTIQGTAGFIPFSWLPTEHLYIYGSSPGTNGDGASLYWLEMVVYDIPNAII